MEADVPLLIPEVNADHLALLDAQGAARGWKGRIVTNPNCVDRRAGDGARAAAPVRPEDVDGHDAAGDFGRRLSGRAVVGHPRQRHSVHRRARKRRSRPRRRRFSARCGDGAVEHASGDASARTTTRVPVQNGHTGSISVALEQRPPTGGDHRRVERVPRPAAGARPAVGAAAADRVPDGARTVRSRRSTSNRDGGMTVTRRPPAAVPGARLQVRRARPQHDSRRRRRRDSERRADAPRGAAVSVRHEVRRHVGRRRRRDDRASSTSSARQHRAQARATRRRSSSCRRCRR